jgi:hypothetical protein
VRIPFPERISLGGIFCFSALLFTVQLLEGTSLVFAVCCLLFINIATIAFNLAGGFTRPSGAYVFFYAVLTVILGLVWKAYIGEPADSNLTTPLLTISVFLGGISSMLAAVFISRKLTTKRAILRNMVTDADMRNATVGSMFIGILLIVILSVVPHGEGSVLSALTQLNRFLPMAIVLGTIHQIRKSGGTSSVNIPVLISGVVIFCVYGLLYFSKEGMFIPVLSWAVAAASQRYNLSFYKIAAGAGVIFFMFHFLVPYSQYGRNFRDEDSTFSQKIDIAASLLTNLEGVREESNANANEVYELGTSGYYNTPQGFFDRLQMISVDDALISYTDQSGTIGYAPIIVGFENLVPHFLWKNKPVIGYGNYYAHELGNLAEDDFSTGISFSPTGEGFHIDRWTGVLIVAPILWIILFTLFDSLCGDVRSSPWGLLVIAYFAHMAPEGMLGGVIYMFGFTTIGIVFVAVTAEYILPLIGTLIVGPEQRRIVAVRRPHSFPRRISPRRVSASPSSEGIGS